MKALTRWNPFALARRSPFGELPALEEYVNRMLREPFSLLTGEELMAGEFMPPVDVYEDEKSIRMKMEIPGIEEKDINVRVDDNLLTVSGERKMESETKKENYHRIERSYGSFSRSFTLPSSVNKEDVTASYSKGVLTITMGKRAEARPKVKVEVKPEVAEKGEKKAA